jgi:asparagine synthase (glutamine-hydrolysing)
MCGIAGFITTQQGSGENTAEARVLGQMTGVLEHRGPDDFGHHCGPRAFLGQRRLSIVDLAGGHQPMYTADRSKVIVYNGEVFNHAETRRAMESDGYRFATRSSDTETILQAWAAYGATALNRFRGMFAFAIWDSERQQLFVARDRLGIKPLYYYWDGKLFAFGSEIKALLEHPDIAAAPNEEYLAEYLTFGYVSGENTLFRNIRKLMPGHWLTWTAGDDGQGRLHIEQYWDVPFGSQPEEQGYSEADWIAQTRKRLEESVELRLMADVPLGTFLSGGVDSSAITAMVRRMAGGRVKSFAVGYQEREYSELDFARQAADAIGSEHHEVLLSREEFFQAMPSLIWHEDEPITWPSSISLYFVSRLAAQHVKVVLTGEGSDELFAGYERYRWNRLNLRAAAAYRHVPGFVRGAVRNTILNTPLLRSGLRRKLSHTFLGRDLTVESLFLDNFYAAFPAGQREALLKPAWRGRQSPPYAEYLRHWNAHPEQSLISRMLYADQKTYLVELLMKQDQMSMASSIESRVPFLDHHFTAFAMRIPESLKIRGGEQKYILKKAVEDLLPREIVYRTKKGFPTPLRQWLRDPESVAWNLKDGFLAEYIEPKIVEDMLARHRAGLEDCTDRLWRLLNLAHWGDIHFGREGRRRHPACDLAQLSR